MNKGQQLVIIISFFISAFGYSQMTKEEENAYRVQRSDAFYDALSRCGSGDDYVTDFNGKQEFWQVCEPSTNERILTIFSHKDDFYFKEIYYVKDEELVFAKEIENYQPLNSKPLQAWNCEYFIEDGAIVTLISLGHGKTESEDWDEDEILQMYARRIQELAKIK